MDVKHRISQNIAELTAVYELLDEAQLAGVMEACEGAERIFFSGMGRSGNMVKALAIRFMHLGYAAYVAGDAATPSIGAGDLLIAMTSSAKTKVTVNHVEVAQKNGAKTVLISAGDENVLAADWHLCVPARTRVESRQHAGSLFEQSVLVIGDALAACIQQSKAVSTEYMNARHANLQ